MLSRLTFRPDQLFALVLCCLLILIQGSYQPIEGYQTQETPQALSLIDPQPYPAIAQSNYSPLDDPFTTVSARSYLIMDPDSATIIKSRNLFLPLHPASSVKLMTALVAVDTYDLDQVLSTDSALNTLGNKVGFLWGARISVRDLLASILINSGNDAAIILANNHPEGYEGFINQMNQKATELSMHQSSFTNPTGIDDYRQLTTNWDLSILVREVLKNPLLRELVSTKTYQIKDQLTGHQYNLYNTNQLLHQLDQIKGVKTGTTFYAQQVLVSLWEEDDHSLLIVIMGSLDRYADTLEIIEWIKENVVWID